MVTRHIPKFNENTWIYFIYQYGSIFVKQFNDGDIYCNVFGYWRRRSDCSFVLLTTSLVGTTITFYTITYFHNLHSLHANLFSLSLIVFITHFTSSHIHTSKSPWTLCELPANWSECRRIRSETETVSADGLQDNSSARTTQKSHLPPYCCEGVFTEWLPSNGRGTDSSENGRSECCLATSNNIRNSTVKCVYATEVCLQVVA
jgi:hypothetical protein